MEFKKIMIPLLGTALLLSGCGLPDMNNKDLALPADASSYELYYDDDAGEMTVEYNGRLYTYFGDLEGDMSSVSISECIGYINNEENRRFFAIADDPYENYVMIVNVNSIRGDRMFLRAQDTEGKDIYTPPYISSLGYSYWVCSGVHHEMSEAEIQFVVNAENIKFIEYAFEVNGMYAGDGMTGYKYERALEQGELWNIGISELHLNGKADTGKPFTASVTFKVIDTDDVEHEVKGEYVREMMLGSFRTGLEIRYDDSEGYYLFEDV